MIYNENIKNNKNFNIILILNFYIHINHFKFLYLFAKCEIV